MKEKRPILKTQAGSISANLKNLIYNPTLRREIGHKATYKLHVPEFTFQSLKMVFFIFCDQIQRNRDIAKWLKRILCKKWTRSYNLGFHTFLWFYVTWLQKQLADMTDSGTWWLRGTGHEVIKNYWTRHDQEVFQFNISAIVICDSKKGNFRFDVEKSPKITLLHNCKTTVLLFTRRHDSRIWWLRGTGHEVVKKSLNETWPRSF